MKIKTESELNMMSGAVIFHIKFQKIEVMDRLSYITIGSQ